MLEPRTAWGFPEPARLLAPDPAGLTRLGPGLETRSGVGIQTVTETRGFQGVSGEIPTVKRARGADIRRDPPTAAAALFTTSHGSHRPPWRDPCSAQCTGRAHASDASAGSCSCNRNMVCACAASPGHVPNPPLPTTGHFPRPQRTDSCDCWSEESSKNLLA